MRVRSAILGALVAVGSWFASTGTTWAERRLAFVVGIDAYVAVEPLRKARNDAHAVGDALAANGFAITVVRDPTRLTLIEGWQRFLDAIAPGDVAAVFFAGHGVQVAGVNYLLPADTPAALGGEHVLRATAVSLGELMDSLRQRAPRLSLFIIDACRNNPLRPPPGLRSLGGTRGLARVELAAPPSEEGKGEFVLFSAGADQLALEGTGSSDTHPNSVYTRHLVRLLSTAGLSLQRLAKAVQLEVAAVTRAVPHEQVPAYYDGVTGEFYLNGEPGSATTIVDASGAGSVPSQPVVLPSPVAMPPGRRPLIAVPVPAGGTARPLVEVPVINEGEGGRRPPIDPRYLPREQPEAGPSHGVLMTDPAPRPLWRVP